MTFAILNRSGDETCVTQCKKSRMTSFQNPMSLQGGPFHVSVKYKEENNTHKRTNSSQYREAENDNREELEEPAHKVLFQLKIKNQRIY